MTELVAWGPLIATVFGGRFGPRGTWLLPGSRIRAAANLVSLTLAACTLWVLLITGTRRIEFMLAVCVVVLVEAGCLVLHPLRRWGELGIIIVLYCVSFGMPAAYNRSSFTWVDPRWDGSSLDYLRAVESVSLLGISAFYGSFVSLILDNPVWLANPIFWVGVHYLRKRRWWTATVCGISAVWLGANVMYYLSDGFFVIAPGTQVFDIRMGYFVWMGSFVGLTLSGVTRGVSCRFVGHYHELANTTASTAK